MIKPVITRRHEHTNAVPISPLDIFRKTAMGKVSVLNLVAPATIKVAPNSPTALAQARTIPVNKPCRAIGRVTLKKT
jgi:hypothetical protein